MTTWSGNEDGTVSDAELAHDRRRVKGGDDDTAANSGSPRRSQRVVDPRHHAPTPALRARIACGRKLFPLSLMADVGGETAGKRASKSRINRTSRLPRETLTLR